MKYFLLASAMILVGCSRMHHTSVDIIYHDHLSYLACGIGTGSVVLASDGTEYATDGISAAMKGRNEYKWKKIPCSTMPEKHIVSHDEEYMDLDVFQFRFDHDPSFRSSISSYNIFSNP